MLAGKNLNSCPDSDSDKTLTLINPRNSRIPIIEDRNFFLDYRELFLDLVIPIIEDPLYISDIF